MKDGAAGAAPRTAPDMRDGRQRLVREHHDTLAALFDATTFRHLDRLCVAAGWRCWEVGAGAATVPAWLVRRVGPEGHVLATDARRAKSPVRAGPL
ncbi:hypothetical protein [Streptomyces sp. MK7]|uniref:hypothetical protein n=1 Tax=Streptomyces sp. MK7 TaxID=3067635 RepID=UPI0037D9F789